jgi:XRE family transcriptional regulator, fatty acid utilization regulator
VKIGESSQNAASRAHFSGGFDPLLFGRRLRHLRNRAGITLEELGRRLGKQPSYLSMLENGKRDPNLRLIDKLAAALGVASSELLVNEAPDRRSRLEIELTRAQEAAAHRQLGLPQLRPSARIPDEVLEHIVGLYAELDRSAQVKAATPAEASRANSSLRAEMRQRNNYFPEIEAEARSVLSAVGYQGSGAISPRLLTGIAAHFGFSIHQVLDLPSSTRSITDLRRHRIYIPQRDELRTRAARSVVLQTLGHFALAHRDPVNFEDYLRQRVEANYFAGAVLAPEEAAVQMMQRAKQDRDLSVEDLKELFYVSYEMAAHRFTNLATCHLGIRLHFIRSDAQGVIWKAYENDGVPFPTDAEGGIHGQRLCRQWGTRQAFESADKFSIHYQYTDTPGGTYWCATHVEADREPHHAVTVGAPFEFVRFFRGRESKRRSVSTCPDEACCRQPPANLASRWENMAWPSPRSQSHVLAALPLGTFPGVDFTEVYEFLERQGP